jgi:hypothetical protein
MYLPPTKLEVLDGDVLTPGEPEIVLYNPTPSEQVYGPLDVLFRFMNGRAFDGKLPPCLTTVRAKGTGYGFYAPGRIAEVGGTKIIAEIALNPKYFCTEPIREAAGTFVHEMCHHWQSCHGKPGRGRYHNLQFAQKMREVGLEPSDTGKPGGKPTGDHVSHYIIEGGLFAVAFAELEATGWTIGWGDRSASAPGGEDGAAEGAKPTREKYVCSCCGAQVLGASSVGDLITSVAAAA